MATASAASSAAPRRASRLWSWLDDGRILQLVFYALLGGAAVTLWLDYEAIRDTEPFMPGINAPPVLPSVERPDTGDAEPFLPRDRVTADPDLLRAPLVVTLEAGGVLRLEGTIEPGAASRVAEEIAARGEYVETVALNSPGGSVDDALAIAALIRDNAYATEVADGALCASSCPLVFSGGVERRAGAGAAIGVHQAFAAGESLTGPAQAMSDAQTTTARVVRHLTDMGVSSDVWVHALETPPDRLYYFTAGELIDYDLATEIVN